MAQDYQINPYSFNDIVDDDGKEMNKNFECLRTMFSGTSAPANALAGHPWYDTGASQRNKISEGHPTDDNQNLLKIYNQSRSVWYGVMTGDINQKIPVYRPDQMHGWVIDDTVEDRVIAIKGGSKSWNTTAGQALGDWNWQPHALSDAQIPAHTHPSTSTNGNHVHTIKAYFPEESGTNKMGINENAQINFDNIFGAVLAAGNHAHAVNANTGGDNEHNHGGINGNTWRPSAALCTIQYLDI